MGLGGIYAGIGLAQGLGQAGKEFIDSYQSAQDSARKRKKEDLEIGAMERQEEIRKKRAAIQQDLAGLGTKGAPTIEEKKPPVDLNSINSAIMPKYLQKGMEVFEKEIPKQTFDSEQYAKDFQESLTSVKNTALEIQQKYFQLASLSESPADAQVYTQMGQQALEDYYSRNYSQLLGQAKGSPELIDGILEGVTGRKLQVSKDGDAYTIRDENGYIINTIKPNQLGTLTSPEAFKAFVKDSIALDQEKEKELRDLNKQKEILAEQQKNAMALQKDDQNFRAKIEKEGNALAWRIAQLQFGGAGLQGLIDASRKQRLALDAKVFVWNDKTKQNDVRSITLNEAQIANFNNRLYSVMENYKNLPDKEIYSTAVALFLEDLKKEFGNHYIEITPLYANAETNVGQIIANMRK